MPHETARAALRGVFRRATPPAAAPSGVIASVRRDTVRPPMIRIAVEPTTAGWRIDVGGEIDIATSPQLQRVLDDVIDGSDDRVLADLSAVEFIDVSGLRALLSAVDRGGAHRFGVANPSPAVRRLFEIIGLDMPTLCSTSTMQADPVSDRDASRLALT